MVAGACGDDGGSDGGPSELLAAIPDTGFAGRTTDVVLVANDTDWLDGTTADFGPGITVNSVEVLGTGALVANVTLAADAELGARDVTVGDDVLTDGFAIQSPLQIETEGSLAQGSLAVITVTNLDLSNPFDITSTGDGFFTPLEFVNFSATAPDGLDVLVGSVEPFSASLTVLTDVGAAEGAALLDIMSGPAGEEIQSMGELTVTARSATPLTLATPTNGTVNKALTRCCTSSAPRSSACSISRSRPTARTPARPSPCCRHRVRSPTCCSSPT